MGAGGVWAKEGPSVDGPLEWTESELEEWPEEVKGKRVGKFRFGSLDLWEHLKKILHENKHNRTIQLDNKLLNLDCGDVSITKYFQIISLAARLTKTGSKVLDEKIRLPMLVMVYVIILLRE